MLSKQCNFLITFLGVENCFLSKCRTMLLFVLVNNISRCVLQKHVGSRTPLGDVIRGVSICQNFGMVFLILRLENIIFILVWKSVTMRETKLSRIEIL